MIPHKCPVCDGTTKRPDGEFCISCERGIVWSPPVAAAPVPAPIVVPYFVPYTPVPYAPEPAWPGVGPWWVAPHGPLDPANPYAPIITFRTADRIEIGPVTVGPTTETTVIISDVSTVH